MFFLDTIYVAKFLWRDDSMAAKYILETFVKDEHLRPMLEWHLEIEHGWSVKPGPYGRRLKKWLRPDLWEELESTFTGADLEDNWEALFRTIDSDAQNGSGSRREVRFRLSICTGSTG